MFIRVQGLFCSSPHHISKESGAQEVGRGHNWAAEPHWPKEDSIPVALWLATKRGKISGVPPQRPELFGGEEFFSFSSLVFLAFIFSLWHFPFSLQVSITILVVIIVLSWSQLTNFLTFTVVILHPFTHLLCTLIPGKWNGKIIFETWQLKLY